MTFSYTCFVNIPTHMTKYIKDANTDTLEVLFLQTEVRGNSSALISLFA